VQKIDMFNLHVDDIDTSMVWSLVEHGRCYTIRGVSLQFQPRCALFAEEVGFAFADRARHPVGATLGYRAWRQQYGAGFGF